MPAVGYVDGNHLHDQVGHGIIGPAFEVVDLERLRQAHLYILRNTVDVSSYVEEHLSLLKAKATIGRKGPRWFQHEHGKKRKVTRDLRGPAMCLKLRSIRKKFGKVAIQFNKYLTPRGPNRKMYSSFVGMNDMFELECDMKWAVFKHADNLWRGWKSRLNTYDVQPLRYTDPEKLKDNPKRANGYVTPQQWAEFVKWVTSPEFDEISEKMRQRRNNQRNQARVGRKGMTGCNDEHMAEGDEEPDRADSWLWARMNAAGGFDDPNIQVIADEILRLKAKQKNEELVLGENEDILSLATGIPIKAGKIQACGFNATKTMLKPSKKMTAETAELIRLRRKVREFEDGKRASADNRSSPKGRSDVEEELAASQKKKAAQEEEEKSDSEGEGEIANNDNFRYEQTDIHSFVNPNLVNFPDSFPGKYTKGPFYPHEFLNTELMDDIFKQKQPTFEEKECTLFAIVDGKRVIVAGGRVVADGALSFTMVHLKQVLSDQYKHPMKVIKEQQALMVEAFCDHFEISLQIDVYFVIGEMC
ncbi:hypothetical protein ACFE04_029948 [Oxalis oulophora]